MCRVLDISVLCRCEDTLMLCGRSIDRDWEDGSFDDGEQLGSMGRATCAAWIGALWQGAEHSAFTAKYRFMILLIEANLCGQNRGIH